MMLFYLSMVSTVEEKQKVQRVYEQYYGLMMYIAGRYCPQRSDAEDVVHDAIVKIIRHIDCVDVSDETRTKAFCVTVVKHTALDRLKAKETNVISMEDFQEEPVHSNDFASSASSRSSCRHRYRYPIRASKAVPIRYSRTLALLGTSDFVFRPRRATAASSGVSSGSSASMAFAWKTAETIRAARSCSTWTCVETGSSRILT